MRADHDWGGCAMRVVIPRYWLGHLVDQLVAFEVPGADEQPPRWLAGFHATRPNIAQTCNARRSGMSSRNSAS